MPPPASKVKLRGSAGQDGEVGPFHPSKKPEKSPGRADLKSAIRQIKNVRYRVCARHYYEGSLRSVFGHCKNRFLWQSKNEVSGVRRLISVDGVIGCRRWWLERGGRTKRF